MAASIREAHLSLGGKKYVLRTALPSDEFDEVAVFIKRLFGSLDPKVDNENRLLLALMLMGYKLLQFEKNLNGVMAQYGNTPEAEETESAE